MSPLCSGSLRSFYLAHDCHTKTALGKLFREWFNDPGCCILTALANNDVIWMGFGCLCRRGKAKCNSLSPLVHWSIERDARLAYFAPTLRWLFTLTLNLIDQAWQSDKVALALINSCHKTLVTDGPKPNETSWQLSKCFGPILRDCNFLLFCNCTLEPSIWGVGRWISLRDCLDLLWSDHNSRSPDLKPISQPQSLGSGSCIGLGYTYAHVPGLMKCRETWLTVTQRSVLTCCASRFEARNAACHMERGQLRWWRPKCSHSSP